MSTGLVEKGDRRLLWVALASVVLITLISFLEHVLRRPEPILLPPVDRTAISNALSLLQTNALTLTNAGELKANQQLQEVLRRQLR